MAKNWQKEHREEWNAYLRGYRKKRRAEDKEYAEKMRKQSRDAAQRAKDKRDNEIAALKAEIETLKQQNNN